MQLLLHTAVLEHAVRKACLVITEHNTRTRLRTNHWWPALKWLGPVISGVWPRIWLIR